MHITIVTTDEVQRGVLVGVAVRQGMEVATVDPQHLDDSGGMEALHTDAVVLDEVDLTTEVEATVRALHARLPAAHLLLLLEGEAQPATDAQRAAALGASQIQRKPFHPAEFLRQVARTVSQEAGGARHSAAGAAYAMPGASPDGEALR